MPPLYSWLTVVSSASATSVVTLTSAQARTADSTITPTISARKMMAGCGTLLPTRSIQPRNPPEDFSAAAAVLTARTAGDSKRVASSTRRRAPKPLAPLLRHVRTAGCCAVPAMSTCAHGIPSTNSSRKSPAVMEPALTPPMLVMSAMGDSSCAR